jgi:hypothetical protein
MSDHIQQLFATFERFLANKDFDRLSNEAFSLSNLLGELGEAEKNACFE